MRDFGVMGTKAEKQQVLKPYSAWHGCRHNEAAQAARRTRGAGRLPTQQQSKETERPGPWADRCFCARVFKQCTVCH